MRLIDADEIMAFPYNEASGTDEQIDTWIREVFDIPDCDGIYLSDTYEDELKELCWKVIEGMLNVIETQPIVHELIKTNLDNGGETLEKEKPIKPEVIGDGCDKRGNVVFDTWICPNCETHYEIDYDIYNYCPECGQRINRTELDELI